MSDRIAYFGKETELFDGFELELTEERIFEDHYNITRGTEIPVIKLKNEKFYIDKMQWGKNSGNGDSAGIQEENIDELEKKSVERVVLPISGFYIWKEKANKDHPFFVRKIDNSFLYSPAFSFKEESGDLTYAEFLSGEANTLIQPISEIMPVVFKQNRAKEWLRGEVAAKEVLKSAGSEFLITELTVHRVNKKVKDSSKNDESLIQPIPK
jgi:putative SOS response-associated peptidase YedK